MSLANLLRKSITKATRGLVDEEIVNKVSDQQLPVLPRAVELEPDLSTRLNLLCTGHLTSPKRILIN
jgi:hypothetical protein